MHAKSLAIFAIAAALQACSSAPLPDVGQLATVGQLAIVDGTPSNSGAGNYRVTTNGTTITLPASNALWTPAGMPRWSTTTTLAAAKWGFNGVAVGGVQNGTYFAGIAGVKTGTPATGTATLTGEYYAVDEAGTQTGQFTTLVDFGQGTISGTGTNSAGATVITASGTNSNGDITGTVTYAGQQATWGGGFFNPGVSTITYEIDTAFVGNTTAGVIYGLQ